MNLISHMSYFVGQVFLFKLILFKTNLLEKQRSHCHAALIQTDTSKTVVPAALNLIIERTSLS